MNILIINENFAAGGVPSVIVELINAIKLEKGDIYFNFVLLNQVNDYTQQIDFNQHSSLYLHEEQLVGGTKKLFALFSDAYKIHKHISKNQYDVILINADSFQLTLPLALATLFTSKKISIIGWVHACLDQVKYYPNQLIKYLHQKSYLIFDRVVCVSNTAKSSLKNYLGNKIFTQLNTEVIYNYFNKYAMLNSKEKQTICRAKQFKLLSVGRVSVEKRLDILLQALLILKTNTTIDVSLTVVGAGDELDKIRELAQQHKLLDCVEFVGKCMLPFEKFSDHDMFISCSETESFSLVVGEALSVGMPVVVTNTGAAEVVDYGKYGVVVPINDAQALADAIYKLATDAELYQYYQKQTQFAFERFDSQMLTQQWLNLFSKLLT